MNKDYCILFKAYTVQVQYLYVIDHISLCLLHFHIHCFDLLCKAVVFRTANHYACGNVLYFEVYGPRLKFWKLVTVDPSEE